MLATKHDSLWARIWTRPQENPLSLWGQQLECGGSWLSSLKGHEIRSQKTWIWGQQLVSGLGWKGPCHWSRWWSQHQPLRQDPSPQGPYTWMPATRQTGTKFNEDPSTSAAMGLRVTGPICPGTCCVCWGNLCYPQKRWWMWKITVYLDGWQTDWVATGRPRIQAWREGLCWYSVGLQAQRCPNVCICLPVRMMLNQAVNRTQARGVKRAPDAATDSSWAENPQWYLRYLWLHLENDRTSVFTSELRSSSDGEEKGTSQPTICFMWSREFYTRVLLRQKPSEEQCVTGCQGLPTEMDLG